MKTPTRIALSLAAAALAGTAFAVDTNTAATGKTKVAERSGFERLDRNDDGYISPAEARAVPALARDFRTFDLNKDGKLNHAEYVAASIKEDAIAAKDKVVEKMSRNKASDAPAGSSTRTPPPAESSR